MKSIVDKIADRIRLGYLAAFFLLLISYLVSYFSTQQLVQQAQMVNHTNIVIHDLENVVSFVTKAESSVRGYMILKNNLFRSTYYLSHNNADSTLKRVKLLTVDNPIQQKNIDTLQDLVNDKFFWLERGMAKFDSGHTISLPVIKGSTEGTLRMAKVEDFAHSMQEQERLLGASRYSNVTKYTNTIKVFNVLSLIMAILLTFYSIFTFTKENKAKKKETKKALSFQKQLEVRIEELAALNAELIELKNMEKFAVVGRISRTIAHEVRNPLTNINLATEQLRNEILPSGDSNILFDMVTRNSNRINQLIGDLLDSTRTTELIYTRSSINNLLDNSLKLAQDRINLKQITLIKNYDDGICDIMVDEEKIKIAFLNIVVNAIEAMPDKGILNIATKTKNNKCIAVISDNGKGMPKEDLGRLFEPYFTTKEKGNGLGLTNTQNIILSHNASIVANSEQNIGTSFTISFDFA